MVAIAVAVTNNVKPSAALPPHPPAVDTLLLPNSISRSHRLVLHFISAPHALALLPPSALAPCNIHGTTDHPTTQTCTHLYKTMGPPLLGKSEGAGSLFVSSSMVTELPPTLFLSQPSSLWASGMCTWGLWSRLYSGQPPLVYAPRNTRKNVFSLEFSSTSLTHPHTSLRSICLHLSLRLFLTPILLPFPPASFSCGSDSLYFCYAARTPSPSHSLSLYHSPHKPVSQTRCCSLFIVHSSCFVFFPAFACFPENFASPLSEPFSDSDSLNFDASSQVVGEKWKIEIWKHLKSNEIASSSMSPLPGGSAWTLAGVMSGFLLGTSVARRLGFSGK